MLPDRRSRDSGAGEGGVMPTLYVATYRLCRQPGYWVWSVEYNRDPLSRAFADGEALHQDRRPKGLFKKK